MEYNSVNFDPKEVSDLKVIKEDSKSADQITH